MCRVACGSVLVGFLVIAWAKGDNSAECHQWNSVAANSTRIQPGLTMTCRANSSCTGIDCKGIYTYKIPSFTGNYVRNVDFCFGFRLNPCDSPVSVDLYLQVPEKSVSAVFRRSSSDNIQVPNLTYLVAAHVITADVFLDVTMGTLTENRLDLEVDVTVRADYKLGQTWPQGLRKRLVPRQGLSVSQCANPAPPAQLVPGHCTPPKAPETPALKPTSAKPTVTPSSSGEKPTTIYLSKPGGGQGCNPHSLGSCPPNRVCVINVCECQREYRSNSQGCQPYTTPVPDVTTKANSVITTKAAQRTTVLASAVVASVVGVILLVAVTVIIVRWRRARAQYANHELLLNNDDNMVM